MPATGPFTLNGNGVELGGGITNESQNTQTVNLPLTLIGNQTIDAVSGSVVIAGGIGQSGGGYGITKTGSGTAVLSGVNTYSGVTTVSQGTLVIASASALPDGTSLVVGAGGIFVFDPSQAAGRASVIASPASAPGIAAALPVTGGPAMPIAATAITATAPANSPAASPASTTCAYSPGVVVSPVNGEATPPASLPGKNDPATAASGNSATTVLGSTATASPVVQSQSAVPMVPLSAMQGNFFAAFHDSVLGPASLPASRVSAPPAAAILRPKSPKHQEDSPATKDLAQAHDTALQSLNVRAAVEEADAAALWNLDGNWSSGPSDWKHNSINSALDAVMAMLARM